MRRALLFLPLLVYLLLPTRNFYWDGVAFAINIEKHLPASDLIHPNHLIYALCGSWLYRLTEMLGLHVRALFLLQAANAVLAGLSVVLFDRMLKLRAWTLVFAFSATWWKFATDANAYIPSIFFLLCAYILLEHPRRAILAGVAQAAAMLFHQLAILFLPVAWVRLRHDRRALLTYTGAVLLPTAACYLAAYSVTPNPLTMSALLSWLTAHSPDSGFSFNPLKDAALTIRGTFRLFFGGKLNEFHHDAVSFSAMAFLILAIAALLIWTRPPILKPRPPLALIVWTAAYAGFLFFWMPQNTFYRLFYLPPLIVLLAFTTRTLWIMVPVIALWNFTFLIYPQSRADTNAPLRLALERQKDWPPGTPILYHTFHPDLWTISYFNFQAAWVGIDSVDTAQLDHLLDYARKQRTPLWIEATAYDLIASKSQGKDWLASHSPSGQVYKDDKHDFRFYQIQ